VESPQTTKEEHVKRLIATIAVVTPLALMLTACGPSPEQQRQDTALEFARSVAEDTPDAVCDDYAGDALVDREGWEDIAVESVAVEPTVAGEYIVGLRFTQDGEEKHARVWVASAGDDGYCVRIAADGQDGTAE
jgi:hypothetical protein